MMFDSCTLQGSAEDAEGFAQRAQQLLQSKADMLQECVGLTIDSSGCLAALPVLCAPGHHAPLRQAQHASSLGNCVSSANHILHKAGCSSL